MTDWLPVVGGGLAGIFTTLWFMLQGLRETDLEARAERLKRASAAFWTTTVVTAVLYGLYLVFDEHWLWYT